MAAKRAGYAVTAIDGFADKQTIKLAVAAIVVRCGKYGFDADALMAVIAQLDASQYMGFVFGSGFEAQPDLLQKIAATIPLIGNSAETVNAVKATNSFFTALESCNIPYPKVYEILPENVDSITYLRKLAGGCGGTHISIVNADCMAPLNEHYYQQLMDGCSVSLLFYANMHGVEVVGFNEQWLSPTKSLPFRYGGAVSNIVLPEFVQQQLIEAAKKLAIKFGLIGLNSLDAIVRDNIAYVLEINPRLSATFDLYDNGHLMDVHIQACIGATLLQYQYASGSSAQAVVYASADIVIPHALQWPSWVVDTPQLASPLNELRLLAGEPICTVLAQADNAIEAKLLVQSRLKKIQQLLQQND